jgi:outer membrane protein OmpA-like peptidoglycan-associated protein
MKSRRIIILLCVLCAPVLVWSQTAVELEAILESPALSYGRIARFVLEASGKAALPGSEEAFDYARERNWLPKNAAAPDTARLDAVSLLLMQSLDIKGGFLYSIFRNPHYAYRELIYKKVIQDRSSPDMPVSGDFLLFILGRGLSIQENSALTNPYQTAREAGKRERQRVSQANEINARLQAEHLSDVTATATSEGVVISLSNIQFQTDSVVLADSELPKLDQLARILKIVPSRKLLIIGHTAFAGTSEGQRRISLERAQAVADYLIQVKARNRNEIAVMGYGAARPVADNNTPEGMARNRRVEITILEDD